MRSAFADMTQASSSSGGEAHRFEFGLRFAEFGQDAQAFRPPRPRRCGSSRSRHGPAPNRRRRTSTGCSSLTMQAMLTCRLTPPTSTVASFLSTSSICLDAARDSEAHGVYPWFDLWARLSRPRVDQPRGADRRLAERKSAVIGGNLRVGEHGETLLLEAANDLLEQHAVLEASARKRDSVEARAALVRDGRAFSSSRR